MGCAPYFLCLLVLVSASTPMYNGEEEEVEKVSGDDNAVGMLTSFRSLFGLAEQASSSSREAPPPVPMEEALTPSPAPMFPTHVRTIPPLYHKTHYAPALRSKDDGSKARHRRIHVVAVAVSVGAVLLVIFGGVAVLAAYRRCQRRRRDRPTSCSNSKVSYDPDPDPGPEMFYLNTLAPILEMKNAPSSESLPNFCIQCDDLPPRTERASSASSVCSDGENLRTDSLPTFSRPRSSLSSSESVRRSSPSQNGETTRKCEPDFRTESLHSDDNDEEDDDDDDEDESFHSICNCHSSDESISVVSEANLSCPSGRCSPFSGSSHRSTSSEFKPVHFPPVRTHTPPTLVGSKHPFPSTPNKPPSHPWPKFECTTPQATISSQIDHPLRSSCSTSRCNDHPKEESTTLEMTLLAKNPICTSPRPTLSFSPLKPTTNSSSQPTKPVSSNTTTSKPATPIPPRPPLHSGNVPTPPPPPPPLPPSGASSLQSGGRNPPPPPPPCLLPQQSAAVGKDGMLLPKLKPLHWDKVRATPDRSMVWDKLRSSSFELDEQMIESLFGYKTQSNAKTEEAKNKNSSPSKHVLDHKRLQNITILLKALNATAEQVCGALKQGRGLSAQQLEALAKMVPTKEEEEKLANFKGDTSELGHAEIFMKAILNVPFAFSRIQVMLFRETFEDEVVHLKKSFAMLEEACKELRSSRLFFRLLEAVLKTGNRMNVGTIRGGARAFKLDTLLKLADVKGADGKTTLLHFVVQEIIRSEGVSATEKKSLKTTNKPKTAEEREEDYRVLGLDIVSGLSTELCNVKKTASVDLDVLASSVSNLSEGMKQLKRLVEVDVSLDEDDGSFANSMRLFSMRAEKAIKKLKDDEDRVLVHVREITEYYHGDVGKEEVNPLRIFVIVRDFLGMLDRVCKELGSSKTHWSANSDRQAKLFL